MATWDATYETLPPGTLESGGLGDDRIRSWKAEIGSRFNQEHKWSNTGSTGQGKHNLGSTRAYYQAAAPTLRPDALTALGALDDGRLYVDSDTSEGYIWDGTAMVSLTGNAIVDQGGGTQLKLKILEIGSWNMYTDTIPDTQPVHNLLLSSIRYFDVIIQSDIGSLYPLTYGQGTFLYASGGNYATTTEIYCERNTLGFFRSSAFVGSGTNRGYVLIWYTEA